MEHDIDNFCLFLRPRKMQKSENFGFLMWISGTEKSHFWLFSELFLCNQGFITQNTGLTWMGKKSSQKAKKWEVFENGPKIGYAKMRDSKWHHPYVYDELVLGNRKSFWSEIFTVIPWDVLLSLVSVSRKSKDPTITPCLNCLLFNCNVS